MDRAGLGALAVARLALGPREHIAIVGAGGKTTLLLALWDHLAPHRRVLATTTTKVAAWEVAGRPFASSGRDGDKLLGLAAAEVDARFASGPHDVVLVEADGARHQWVKAPGPGEPVVPSSATLVVAVLAADALGGVIADVAFRPELVAAVARCRVGDTLTPERAARVMASPDGGRKGVPAAARFAVVVNRVDATTHGAADDAVAALARTGTPCVLLPTLDDP